MKSLKEKAIKLFEILTSDRFKSFYWRLSMMCVAAILSFFAEHAGLFPFSPEVTGTIGLILGEFSKKMNNKYGSIKESKK